MGAPESIDLLAWRVKQLEMVEAAMREELYELRKGQDGFVTRKDLEHRARARREWPVILAAIAASTVSVTDLLIRLAGG